MITPLNKSDAAWVDQTLGRLTLREKLGQLLIPRLTRESASRDTGDALEVRAWVERFQMGGGHAFGGDFERTRALVKEAQDAAKVPLLISGDLERGAGQRIAGFTEFAGQLSLGACNDLKLAARMGEEIAVEGAAVGYNWVFGPVVDLSIDPENLSHIRTLGSDPRQVGRLAAAIIKAIQKNAMAACAKHYPGGGIDNVDSHLTTPINPLSKPRWKKVSAVPFQAAIDAGVWSVMVSPAACPGIDPDCGDPLFPRPVMVSRTAIEKVLRQELGFDGLVVTDAVTMGGLTMHYRRLDMLLACLNAGNDMLLFVRRLGTILDFFEKCLADGRLKESRVEQACRRVLELKARLGLHRRPRIMPDADAGTLLNAGTYAADAQRLAEKSITLLRDRRKIIPLPLRPGLRVGSVLITNRPEFTLEVFEDTLRKAGCAVTPIKNPPDPEALYDRIENAEFDLILVGFYYPPQWGWSTARAHGPEVRCLMSGFPIANKDVPAVYISWANPYHLHEFAFMDPYINTYGGAAGTQIAAAKALLGQIPIVGKSPVAQPPFFNTDDGLRRPKRK